MQPTHKTYTVKEATLKMMKFCAYQERCHQEIEQKLKDMRMIPEARQEIIYKLIQENFLNEERFAQSFARGKFNQKKWGKIRIAFTYSEGQNLLSATYANGKAASWRE